MLWCTLRGMDCAGVVTITEPALTHTCQSITFHAFFMIACLFITTGVVLILINDNTIINMAVGLPLLMLFYTIFVSIGDYVWLLVTDWPRVWIHVFELGIGFNTLLIFGVEIKRKFGGVLR